MGTLITVKKKTMSMKIQSDNRKRWRQIGKKCQDYESRCLGMA